ncbi:MAG: glycosyltransferase family 39 protein [Nitrospirales bacterium]|nr:glycosyltransferase family 39 protein [Nitrospirales bacterium]
MLLLAAWLLGVDGGTLFGPDLGALGLTDRDEGSNAEAAREMLETGDWISPTLNYEPRYAKPAFVYWLISGSYALFGINEFAARLPSALSGLCLLLLQFVFVRRWAGPMVALYASCMLLLNLEFLGINRMVLTDPELVVFTTLAGYSFWHALHHEQAKRWLFAVFYLAMGCGMLVKGPVGIIIPLVGVVPYLTLTRQWGTFWQRGFPLIGFLLVAVVAAPWYVMMFHIHGDAYWAAAQANTTGRFMSPMEGHGGTLLFYVPVLLIGFFPWSACLPSACYHALKRWKSFWRGQDPATQEQYLECFLSLWVVGLLLFFTLSATRLPHYIYPLFPAAALLVALWWRRFLTEETPVGLTASTRILIGVGYLLGIAMMFVPAVFQLFMKQIAKEFPAAVQVDLTWLPSLVGLVIVVGTMLMRQCMRSETKRHLAVWVGCGMMLIFTVVVARGGLSIYQQYFIGPPQELAVIAGYNLGPDDRLIQFGRKRPSLGFYAKHKVHFLGVNDEELPQHLTAPGRKMAIIQTQLRGQLPEAMAHWKVVLDYGGFSLLTSEPLL